MLLPVSFTQSKSLYRSVTQFGPFQVVEVGIEIEETIKLMQVTPFGIKLTIIKKVEKLPFCKGVVMNPATLELPEEKQRGGLILEHKADDQEELITDVSRLIDFLTQYKGE